MTWRWWLIAVAAAMPVETLARSRYGVWADRIALALIVAAGVKMGARRLPRS